MNDVPGREGLESMVPVPAASAVSGIHHVAFASRDLDRTHQFYAELIGLTLAHTEVTRFGDGWFRHLFYACPDGSAVAFFDLHGVGEPAPLKTAISTDLGLPEWVNHVALHVSGDQRAAGVERLAGGGYPELIELDHGWCISSYFRDPNGILVELCEDKSGMPIDPETAERARHSVPSGCGET